MVAYSPVMVLYAVWLSCAALRAACLFLCLLWPRLSRSASASCTSWVRRFCTRWEIIPGTPHFSRGLRLPTTLDRITPRHGPVRFRTSQGRLHARPRKARPNRSGKDAVSAALMQILRYIKLRQCVTMYLPAVRTAGLSGCNISCGSPRTVPTYWQRRCGQTRLQAPMLRGTVSPQGGAVFL